MTTFHANHSGRHLTAPIRDKHGRDILAVIVKYTFNVDDNGRVSLAEEPAEPRVIDDCYGDNPANSSIHYPSDLYAAKPGTDVILVGHACPRDGRAQSSIDVRLQVGSIDKTVRVFGTRVWKRGGLHGVQPGPAEPIRRPVPLQYELAWGGFDTSDPMRIVGDERNYVGTGVASDPATLVGEPAVQLEYGTLTGSEWTTPACFGAIHRHWQPRIGYAGTHDEVWEKTHSPLPPLDQDERFNVCVPPDQWSDKPLRGDEPIHITGVTERGTWQFQLPRVALGFSAIIDDNETHHRSHLDTLLIDSDRMCVELTWRVGLVMPHKYEQLQELTIREKQIAEQGRWGRA